MTLYATLDEAKQMMDAYSSTDDKKLLALIGQVSSRIDRLFSIRNANFFAPVIQTRTNFHLDASRINSYDGTYALNEPIMALTSVGIGTNTLVVGTDVQLWQGDTIPYMTLQLVNACCGGWNRFSCNGCASANRFISVSGIWGYNIAYPNAWVDSLQVIPLAGITNVATSFIVADVDAPNALGLVPALSAGNLIQIDTEWLEVVATNTTSNAVTVRRGVNGSAAAAHVSGAVISTFQVEPAINRACYKQAGLEYATIGVYRQRKTTGQASAEFDPDVLFEFEALLSLFANI